MSWAGYCAVSRSWWPSPEAIYPLISDLRSFNQWNPFAQDDPSMQLDYGPVAAGQGGSYAWDSEGGAGQGRIEISEAIAPTRVTMQLYFTRPLEAHNVAVFALQPRGEVTEVSWTMTGRNTYLSKVIDVLVGMDRMVGGQFEKGLAALRDTAERG